MICFQAMIRSEVQRRGDPNYIPGYGIDLLRAGRLSVAWFVPKSEKRMLQYTTCV